MRGWGWVWRTVGHPMRTDIMGGEDETLTGGFVELKKRGVEERTWVWEKNMRDKHALRG